MLNVQDSTCKLLLCVQGWCLRQFLGVEIINPLGVVPVEPLKL